MASGPDHPRRKTFSCPPWRYLVSPIQLGLRWFRHDLYSYPLTCGGDSSRGHLDPGPMISGHMIPRMISKVCSPFARSREFSRLFSISLPFSKLPSHSALCLSTGQFYNIVPGYSPDASPGKWRVRDVCSCEEERGGLFMHADDRTYTQSMLAHRK